jgi:hypothetical protein
VLCTTHKIEAQRMRWAGHVAHMGAERCMQDFGRETCGKETNLKTQA